MERNLTEADAVTAFAKAWNRLDPEPFLQLLSEDARYASQWVFEELVGIEEISKYLRGKMRTVKGHAVNNPNTQVRVEIGQTTSVVGARPVAFMTQGGDEAAVLFEVSNGRISRYVLCSPQMLGVVRSGVYPI